MSAAYRFHGFMLDPAAGTLTGPLGPVPLRPKAMALLELFVAGAGRAIGKDEIFDAVWPGVTVGEETLTQTVHELRRALGDEGPALIRTVPRRGYLFPAEALEAQGQRHRTLAVLPFVNLSSDPEQEFFAAGIRIDLDAALGLIRDIELCHDAALADVELSGSVRASSGQIRVTARLAEGAGGKQLWSGRFEGRSDDIFALQDEITRKVAVAMQVELATGDTARLWDGQTASLAAWERYVVAYGLYLRWTEADNSRARDLLREALAIDPDYLGAKVMLAKTWWYDARFFAVGDDRQRAIAETERLAREALERRPDAANALMTLGGAAWLGDRHDEAVALCRKACEIGPSDAWVLGFSGMILIFSGDLDEAILLLGRAERLSPKTFAWIYFHQGHARVWSGDDAGALACLHRYVAAEPQDPWGHIMSALAHGLAGRPDEARKAVAEARRQQADIDLEQVLRSHRYRDPARLDRMAGILREAGMPD